MKGQQSYYDELIAFFVKAIYSNTVLQLSFIRIRNTFIAILVYVSRFVAKQNATRIKVQAILKKVLVFLSCNVEGQFNTTEGGGG